MLASARSLAANIPILTDGVPYWDAPRRGFTFAPSCVAISRSLCRVYFFKPQVMLRSSELPGAAWLFAESHAPIANAATLILKRKHGAEIWQWDSALTRSNGSVTTASDLCFVPETVLQSAGEGWRQVRTSTGYEAQLWREGELQASLWRRNPFTEEQWRAFALSAAEQGESFPEQPPSPAAAPLNASGPWRRRVLYKDANWRRIEAVASWTALITFTLAAYLYGQSLGAGMEADKKQNVPRAQFEIQRAVADVEDLKAVSTYRANAAPVAALAEAHVFANQFGIPLAAWSIDATSAEFTFPSLQSWATPDDIAATFEKSKRFKNVTPEFLAGGGLRLKARIEARS